MGWVLTASGAIAAPPGHGERAALPGARLVQQRMDRTEIIDRITESRLRLSKRADGSIQAALNANDLEVRKVVQANGDFHVRLAGRQDLVVLVRTGERLRVSRNGESAVVALGRADEEGLDQAQALLAGSRATRAFRSLASNLAPESLASAPGVSIDLLDAWLGLLQGDPGAARRRAPSDRSGLIRASVCAAATCYAEYEAEVCAAWTDFEQCTYDVRWFPGMQEVCAFAWLLRVESAWFRFIACSSFPLKVD